MRKILVLQHAAHRLLGTLDPTLKSHGMNIRYINFERTPEAHPSIQRYNGLIVLGGNMGVYEVDKYPHLKTELKLIEDALKKDIPVLGICLGSQLIAQVLGSTVRKHTVYEIGWYDIKMQEPYNEDLLIGHFSPTEKLFQVHGDTFEIPRSATHLATSSTCESQAFRYGEKVYGLQFHLEVDEAMIQRWMKFSSLREQLKKHHGPEGFQKIQEETHIHLQRSLEISQSTFNNFIKLFDLPEKPLILGTDHGKEPRKRK